MYTRLVSFTGAKNIDAGIAFISDKVVPLLRQQKGYRGLTTSVDRENAVIASLSLWETEADRDASESALAKVREEGGDIIGGELTVEGFEELVAEISQPPVPGSALLVTRITMDPAAIDYNIAFFTRDIVPQIKASPGFLGLRNMINRSTGAGIVGTAWTDQEARRKAAEAAVARRATATARGVTFGDTSQREIVAADLK